MEIESEVETATGTFAAMTVGMGEGADMNSETADETEVARLRAVARPVSTAANRLFLQKATVLKGFLAVERPGAVVRAA